MTVAAAGASAINAEGPPAEPRVYRDRIEPNWSADGKGFWYRNDLPGGRREFVRVDAEAGTRQPAFDHARLADALAKLTGQAIEPDKLPVYSLAFADDGKTVRLDGTERSWTLDLSGYQVAVDPGNGVDMNRLPADLDPRPSGPNGREIEVTFVNETDDEVQLFWSDRDGHRRPYGSLNPGERRAQHTFGRQIWIAVRHDGTVLAVFETADRPGVAVIDGEAAARPERPPTTRPGRRGRGRGRPDWRGGATSPDGRHEAFVRDHNLWVRDLDTRAERQLSTDGTAEHTYGRDVYRDAPDGARLGIANDGDDDGDDDGDATSDGGPPATRPRAFWSPDSRRLVALRTPVVDERRVYLIESAPRDRVQPRLHSYRYAKPGDALPVGKPRLFDVGGAREVAVKGDLFPDPFEIGPIRWDADSSGFGFLYNQRGHQVLRVVAVDANTGQARAVIDERSSTFIDYSGKQFREDLPGTGEIVWMSERDGWNHLYLYDASTGQLKNPITRGAWVVRGVDRVDADKRQVWFRAGGVRPGQDPYHVHFCRVSFDGSGLVVLTEGDGTHGLQFSPDGRYFIDTFSRVDLPPVHELRRADDGRLVCKLEDADVSEFHSAGRAFPERFVAKGRDGTTDIHGILFRPRDFDPAKRYPVIESIYAGPQSAHVPKAFHPGVPQQQRLADRGFVVVQIDGMGTSHRSKAFHDVCWRNLADAGFPDRIAWMKAAAAKHPHLDLSRVGVYGGSAGGQNALGALLFHGGFYRAAVADCGCHDNRMDKIWWNEQWMGVVGPHYAENSNVTHAHRLTGRLLLITGELDRNVDPASTMQVVDALVRADKDFDLLVIPGAGHGAGGSPYGQRRTADFFARHLLDVPPHRSPRD